MLVVDGVCFNSVACFDKLDYVSGVVVFCLIAFDGFGYVRFRLFT